MTKTEEIVWVKNRKTGHTQAMAPEYAAYYLSQRDPVTGQALYTEGTKPKKPSGSSARLTDEDRASARVLRQALKGTHTGVRANRGDPDAPDAPEPRGFGVPDAARQEVATSEGEGPTMSKTASTREPTSKDYQRDGDPDRQKEAEEAADGKGQEAAHADAKKAAASAAKKAQQGQK
jgi:hypothetical protein